MPEGGNVKEDIGLADKVGRNTAVLGLGRADNHHTKPGTLHGFDGGDEFA
jgi:hypothetical protein